MRLRPPPLPALLIVALPAGGCVAQGSFPSLAPRAVEREQVDPPVRAPAPEVPSDPALTGRIAALAAQARQGQSAFEAALGRARTAAAAAGPAGSEGWTAAQVEVSRVEGARGPTVTALAELDALAIERARRPTAAADLAAIAAATAEVQSIADAQSAALEALHGSLAPA